MVVVGDPRGAEVLEKHRMQLDESMTLTVRLDLTRAVLRGYAHATADDGVRGIREIAPRVRSMTDSFGTNSHFCISVLHFAESLFHGVAGLDFDRQGWLG